MLRGDGLTVEGKVYAFLSKGEGLVVKLPAERVAELTSQGAARQVVMGARTMREWVELPQPDETLWRRAMTEAAAYVRQLAS